MNVECKPLNQGMTAVTEALGRTAGHDGGGVAAIRISLDSGASAASKAKVTAPAPATSAMPPP